MKSRALLLIGCISASTCLAANEAEIKPADAGFDSEKLSSLTVQVDALYEDGRIPNYVLALYKDGQNFFSATRGYTRIESGVDLRLPPELAANLSRQKVSKETIFHMASMTKPIVATALLQLVEEGKLSLDDPLKKFFPEFDQMMVAPDGDFNNQFEPAESDILLSHLISHKSGFSYTDTVAGFGDVGKLYRELDIFGDRSKSMQDHLETLASVPLVDHPGRSFKYSVSIDVIGAIIEKVSGLPLDEYLQTFIFTPLGMSKTGFYISSENLSNTSDIYGSVGFEPGVELKPLGILEDPSVCESQCIDWKIQNLIPASYYSQKPSFFSGGGGLLSTSDDYARYLTAIGNGGNLNGVQILKPETVDLHFKEFVSDGSELVAVFGEAAKYIRFGGSFGIKKDPVDIEQVDYYFWGGAFNTFYWLDPLDNTIGMFLTSHWPVAYNISDSLEQIVDEARK